MANRRSASKAKAKDDPEKKAPGRLQEHRAKEVSRSWSMS